MVDIDSEELKRKYLHIDLPICADAKEFIEAMLEELQCPLARKETWIHRCKEWLKKYPVVTEDKYHTPDNRGSIYVFYKILSDLMSEGAVYITTSGTSRVVCRQVAVIKAGQRVITNHSTSPMGYCLPASIGTCLANGKKPVVLITGEGGFQMNIQELQTIKHNKLPVHIIVINNCGYHSIRLTQNAFFKNHTHVGMGLESGDISFPDLEKIAYAYEYPYFESRNINDLEDTLRKFLLHEGYAICQVFVTPTQGTEPKASSKRMEDGKFISMPLEDMYPFLPQEEVRENILI